MSKVDVGKKILNANDTYAIRNRQYLDAQGVFCVNVISSPGSGKTSILTRTIEALKGRIRIGVIEGDIQTDLDAERIRATGAPAIQINTNGACHLSAAQVNTALNDLALDTLDMVFIENVGNLICPGAFELGENCKVVVLSVTEGDDKPVKYPAIFAKSKVLLLNKIDLLRFGLDFDIKRATQDARRMNKDLKIFEISARTGEGLDLWCDWLMEQQRCLRS